MKEQALRISAALAISLLAVFNYLEITSDQCYYYDTQTLPVGLSMRVRCLPASLSLRVHLLASLSLRAHLLADLSLRA